jgi:hypothetical protein
MNQDSDRKRMIDDMLVVISWLPPHFRHEAVLILFARGLRRLEPADLHATRAELVQEAPPCPCGCDNRTALAEILEGHLWLRELGFIRPDTSPG